jgi:hypothetical protein
VAWAGQGRGLHVGGKFPRDSRPIRA